MILRKATVTNQGEVKITPKTADIRVLKGLLHKPGQAIVSIEQMNKAIRKKTQEKFR